jgi:hypothetical protein
MQPEKLISLSPKLHKWSMRPTWYMRPALSNCVNTKCKKEHEQLKNNKYVVKKSKNFSKYLESRNNIRARFNNDNDKKKREAALNKLYKKDMKEKTKLKLKIMKEKDHNDLIDRRLKVCYKESLNTLKYKKLLEKNKLEKKKLTREDINAFDIQMVKIILKEHKGKQYW